MGPARRTLKLFYSYAHEDAPLREKLETALALLKRQKYIEGWHDQRITGGSEWAGHIDARLAEADIVLLMISPDFMDSDYCAEVELQAALARHHQGLTRVVPIVVRPTDWETSDIARLQCLPTGAHPITTWDNVDTAFTNVAQGIRTIAEELQRTQPVGMDEQGAAETRATVWRRARQHWRVWVAAACVALAVGGLAYAWSRSTTLAIQGEAWLDVGEYHSAARDFQHAARWNPFNRRARDGTLVAQIALARHDEVAFRRGTAAVSTAIPENPHGRLLAGDLAYHDHRAGDALQDYQAAYTRRPSFAEAYFRAGVVLRHRGDIAAAKEAFIRALHAHPVARAIPRYSNNLAFCLAKLGSLDAALGYYGQNTQYPLSALEASRLLLQRGELTRARDFVQRAVAWLSAPQVAALPQNQGPWDFETSTDGIQLTELRDKLCYAHLQLAVTMFLLGNEPGANEVVQRVSCAGVVADVRDIVTWDLEQVRHANAALATQIETFQRRIVARLP